jgi:hypothetical protein
MNRVFGNYWPNQTAQAPAGRFLNLASGVPVVKRFRDPPIPVCYILDLIWGPQWRT